MATAAQPTRPVELPWQVFRFDVTFQRTSLPKASGGGRASAATG